MGKYDKDRFQKELSIRYCLARRLLPFLEVTVQSATDLSDTVEVITDLDVLGIEAIGDGTLRRTLFDCKNTNKMSAKKWLHKFGRCGKWNFCLTAGNLALANQEQR
jgi:hypothetical protein